jgi:hypothetical protein
MAWKPLEYVGFLLKHGNFFVSISAAAIALMSPWLTIDAGKIDREYREILIRPNVAKSVSGTDYTIRVKNGGLGPAVIKQIATKFGDECIEFNDNNTREWETGVGTTIREHIIPYMQDGLAAAVRELGLEYKINKANSYLPSVKVMIPQGDEFLMFAIDPEQGQALDKELVAHNSHPVIQRKFFDLAYSLPLWMQFCSATERFCTGDAYKHCLTIP